MARPEFKPTATQRKKVAIAAGGGMSHEAIAQALGIARNTLEKHFMAELTAGASERRLEALQGLHAAAKKGNVSAVKAYLAGEPQFIATPVQPDQPDQQAGPKPQALGKKEAAQQAATVAQNGTGWEGLLPGASPLQ